MDIVTPSKKKVSYPILHSNGDFYFEPEIKRLSIAALLTAYRKVPEGIDPFEPGVQPLHPVVCAPWVIPREDVIIDVKMGMGDFGPVFLGYFLQRSKKIAVAIKRVDTSECYNLKGHLTEAKNLRSKFGINTKTERVFVVV